jgi:hypothetical protein
MKKRIYKKYMTMNPLFASNLYNTGKISYEKYQMAYYSKCFNMLSTSGKNVEETLRELIYGA